MKQSPKKKRSLGRPLMAAGGALVLCAALLFAYNQWDDYRAGAESDATASALLEEIGQTEPVALQVQSQEEPEPQEVQGVELDGAYYMGVISIPALERTLPVQCDWSESKLKHSPCRYSGSLEEGELVIAAHNYTRHFGGLHRLSQGDDIYLTDLAGNQYHYQVAELTTIAGDDIEGMVHSGYDLTLFTCNYGGRARITLRCELVSFSPAPPEQE